LRLSTPRRPPPAPEIALLFRQLCEALTREQPLILVIDDVHWAEPTFLELVEHLADKGRGQILVVCAAREELLEERAEFLGEHANAARIVLDPLTAVETDALLDGLGGTVLESDQRERIVATAEGNPFFLEQLLALALEGGLAERGLPETVQALLAARLDRLGPGERAVLERGAVVGKEFGPPTSSPCSTPPPRRPPMPIYASWPIAASCARAETRSSPFATCSCRRPCTARRPNALRAELHERYADRLDEASPDLAELDEFVGYHLEQACRLRTELGESDRRTTRLAYDGGTRLGDAGIRAIKRGDMPATISLLERAVRLLPPDENRGTS
jgi:hypothetical protein